MRIILNALDTEDALDHLLDLVVVIRREHAELRSRFLSDRDGYPTSSFHHGSPTNEVDDDGTPIPQRSDPVARIVIARDEPSDPIGFTLATVVAKIQQARRLLEAAVSDAAKTRPPMTITAADDIWCTNCLRAKVHTPRAEGRTLCSWCRDEQSDHGTLPSRRLIEAHSRGVRITERLRAEIGRRETEDRAARKATVRA